MRRMAFMAACGLVVMSGCGGGAKQAAPPAASYDTAAGDPLDPGPPAVSDFHVRFASPVPLRGVMRGQISSEGPASCRGVAQLPVGVRPVASLPIPAGTCTTGWRPLVLHFSPG